MCPEPTVTGRRERAKALKNKEKDKYMIDSSAFQGKKAAYYTLGCKLNFSETSTFGKMLEDMGVITAQKGRKQTFVSSIPVR